MPRTLDPETRARTRGWAQFFDFDFKNVDFTVGFQQGTLTVILVITIGFGPITGGFVKSIVLIIYNLFPFLKLNKFTHLYSYCTYVQMASIFCMHVHPNYGPTQDLRFF